MTETATTRDIKVAYRRIAAATHPDQAGTKARVGEFVAAAEAYDVLVNRRTDYDEHRRRLRLQAGLREAREREAAEEAAQAAQEEALRRTRTTRRDPPGRADGLGARPFPDLGGRGPAFGWSAAPEPPGPVGSPLFWNGYGWAAVTDPGVQAVIRDQLSYLRTVRGPDLVVPVTGERSFFLEGFLVSSPDGGDVEVVPGLAPGRYRVAPGRGGFAPFGGPRGDLLVDYRWPDPIRGLDAELTLAIPLKRFRRTSTFVNPVNQEELEVPAGTTAGRYRYRGHGLPGEFRGGPGDLVVDIELTGRPRVSAGTVVLIAGVASIICVLVFLLLR